MGNWEEKLGGIGDKEPRKSQEKNIDENANVRRIMCKYKSEGTNERKVRFVLKVRHNRQFL